MCTSLGWAVQNVDDTNHDKYSNELTSAFWPCGMVEQEKMNKFCILYRKTPEAFGDPTSGKRLLKTFSKRAAASDLYLEWFRNSWQAFLLQCCRCFGSSHNLHVMCPMVFQWYYTSPLSPTQVGLKPNPNRWGHNLCPHGCLQVSPVWQLIAATIGLRSPTLQRTMATTSKAENQQKSSNQNLPTPFQG